MKLLTLQRGIYIWGKSKYRSRLNWAYQVDGLMSFTVPLDELSPTYYLSLNERTTCGIWFVVYLYWTSSFRMDGEKQCWFGVWNFSHGC